MSTSKKVRTQYTLEQKQKLIGQIEALVATGTQVNKACEKFGIADGSYHTWKRNGITAPAAVAAKGTDKTALRNGSIPMEDKQKLVNQVSDLRKTGLNVKEAIAKVGIRPDDYYRYRSQVAKASGTLPAVVEPKNLQMMQFDLGGQKSAPMVLMIGNAEDMKSTLSMLGQVLRGN